MTRSKLSRWLLLSLSGCSTEPTTSGASDPEPPGEASYQVALATAQSCDDV